MDTESKTARAFFNIAKQVSKLSDYSRNKTKIGCVVVYKHRIISTGYNSDKPHPVQAKYNSYRFSEPSTPKLHAETSALIPLLSDRSINWRKVEIFTYRELANGQLGTSRPCKSCMALIKDLGIQRIFYTTYDGYAQESLKH